MFKHLLIATCLLACAPILFAQATSRPASPYVPPAVPLVVHDPYFSVWSCADELTADVTRHWTGAPQPLCSLIRLDGKTLRLMGSGVEPAMRQIGVSVLLTRSIYRFENEQVRVTLSFFTPALMEDVELLARPISYIIWEIESLDGAEHAASLYFSASGLFAVHDATQQVRAERVDGQGLAAWRIGSVEQRVLGRKGDAVRIDWGHLYLAGAKAETAICGFASGESSRLAFAERGELANESAPPTPLDATSSAIAAVMDLGRVGAHAVKRTLLVGYDQIHAVQLMGEDLRPWWRRGRMDMPALLAQANEEFDALRWRCIQFDRELMLDLAKYGDDYARIGAAAYRQALGGCGLAASPDGRLLMFPKENTSNGCISTVDVIYPGAPLPLLFNPTLLAAQLDPVFNYAESPRWKWPFAPHDLGTYPLANGQVYGGGEKTADNQMPVEESGNMILLVAALARAQGNADYAGRHWTTLAKWAEYLRAKGFDPENQLCTDDFMGHLAHNVNLSAKTIEALGAYAMLARMSGREDAAREYRALAEQFAARWTKEADDGDHTRLAFDRPGTWSQKYNLVWDRVLDLRLFPPEVIARELAFYRATQQAYGTPLDNRKDLTKSDWLAWSATMGTDADFAAMLKPLARFLAESPTRVPFADIYNTANGQALPMHARPVIGGVFMRMLADEPTWRRWAHRRAD